jgi:hypothetical protein
MSTLLSHGLRWLCIGSRLENMLVVRDTGIFMMGIAIVTTSLSSK